MGNNILSEYCKFVKPLYFGKDAAHNFDHIERMIKRVDLIKKDYEPIINSELLWFLTCFHGLKSTLNESETIRRKCISFLEGLGWASNDILTGFDCLNRHLNNPVTIEEKIVHDANFIELLGAFGIAKAFTTGGANNQTYTQTIKIYEEEYLDRIKFQTEKGKEVAREGRTYAKNFLNRLKQEI